MVTTMWRIGFFTNEIPFLTTQAFVKNVFRRNEKDGKITENCF